MIKKRKLTRAVAFAILLCFTSLTGAQPLYAIPANTQLPVGGKPIIGEVNIPSEITNNTMNINQSSTTSVIQWDNFSIGADAAVNFIGKNDVDFTGHNSFNYVKNGGPISEIYGQLNALGGNIFIANPAGVTIGNSAQINVGSLYVTNKELTEEQLRAIGGKTSAYGDNSIASYLAGVGTNTDPAAQLMSLGAITNATSVTFDGGRIVLDTDRIYTKNDDTDELEQVGQDWFNDGNLQITTTDKDNVVLGYTQGREVINFDNFSINGNTDKLAHGYMWVHNLDELQAMNTNLNGWYALRNSIDAYATAGWNPNADGGDAGFNPIGDNTVGGEFTGRFDGLDYSIFGLNINRTKEDYVGLFGKVKEAYIRNFTLNSGSIKGDSLVGSAVGMATQDSVISNITNTLNVNGTGQVGGIVGYAANNVSMSNLINTGTIGGTNGNHDVGGIVGYMYNSKLGGETYNLGSVTGGYNVGGIAGDMYDAEIGGDSFQIYNQLNVSGEHNVGGIAGHMYGSSITNAANHGNVTANSYTKDTYQYHTAAAEESLDGAVLNGNLLASIAVKAANAGGIAGAAEGGAAITNVLNDGDVTSTTEGADNHYIAGNVGGIVGRAENTKITNAENKENTVAGAHNVGGVAGFLGGDSTDDIGVNNSVNNGGDITATGARKFNVDANDTNGYVKERVRPYAAEEDEAFNVGNIGGIVGYLYGDKAKVKNSGNRGTVHSANIDNVNNVPETAKAANVGGVVGKIDTPEATTLSDIKADAKNGYAGGLPTVLNSYSTGNVRGYTGVGGVVGMMYNGSVAGSYNLGTVQSTRAVSGGREPLNMGGVVGDTTEKSGASAVLYDVYNAGKIGDDTYQFYGRHVGGVVGRLSGELEKAYNTGDIYNGYGTVGGIVGWWADGNIKNVFNTGNITVVNNDKENGVSQVGGIAGAHSGADSTLSYAYNLGTIRSFTPFGFKYDYANNRPTQERLTNAVGGIIGYARSYQGTGLKIKNVYTTNNIYAAIGNNNGEYTSDNVGLGAIYGSGDYALNDISSAYYVKMYEDSFADLSRTAGVTGTVTKDADGNFAENAFNGFTFNNQTDRNSVNDDEDGWRIYNGTTPILNAFLPNSEGYFSGKDLGGLNIDSVQYGTAANPLLTIINAKDNSTVELNWGDLNSSGNASFAVYNGGLTLNGFGTETGYYRGTIYADGALNIEGTAGRNFNLGSSANLYGTDVTLTANGDATIYGNVTSTNGNISIKGGDIEILGKLSSSKVGEATQPVKNISKTAGDISYSADALKDPTKSVPTVSDAYAHTPVIEGNKKDGDITVTASGTAEVLYGNLGTGSVSTAGEFNVTGGAQENNTLSGGSVYVDSDLSGTTGNINLSAGGEVLLDITNIAKANESEDDPNGAGALHKFLENYAKGDGDDDNAKKITLDSTNDDEIIAIDMWNEGTDTGSFDLDKYNLEGGSTLIDAFDKLNLGNGLSTEDIVHIWISDAEQLKGIQSYYDSKQGQTNILGYNFALKGNIDASALEDYEAIGGGDEAYSGTFDGRDFRIIGLNATATDESSASSGVFGKLAGTVKDLRVYASKFFGGDDENVGAIASEVTEGGNITGVMTFGNTVTAKNGAAGGIAGVNSGSILESTASDSITASGADSYAGGVAGMNTGVIGPGGEGDEGVKDSEAQITANSAVRSGADGAAAIGGVVGDNQGTVTLANSLGVTTGSDAGSTGGIAGTNSGTMTSLYNESIVIGKGGDAENPDDIGGVGGVAGTNTGTMTNAVNATGITATGANAGGIAGFNNGSITSGRNAGAITGTTNVGGMVGSNVKKEDGSGGVLENLSNAIVAAITGTENVGGIAGINSGEIDNEDGLVNEGMVTGTENVGGIAGINNGTIQNVSNQTLVLETDGATGTNFGGIAGVNNGTITDATNTSNLTADNATNVGGIVGENTGDLEGELINEGSVTGKDKVGGLAGSNSNTELLKGTEDNRITVMNKGTVTATDGGAGGIFHHNNKGDIEYANLTNTGTVIGTGQESTGGLFGINSGNISHSTLTNSGTVEGGTNTGGLIGSNSGNVANSSLINEYDAKVTGGDNTGGLIGYNTGSIEGGRNADDTMYVHKIYNNGTVSGALNVGGLIGTNAEGGVLKAAYNTGTVTGAVYKDDDGTEVDHYTNNVGGIVGTNAGTVSSVFNTIMTATGENQSVTGASNVGGLIGNNTGTLIDAYNTTAVEVKAQNGGTKGNAVGENSSTVENVYAANTDGKLVGSNNGTVTNSYTFSAEDDETDGVTLISGDAQKQSGSYEGFDFGSVWKNYDGWTMPMLKVFLTKASYNGSTSVTQTGGAAGLPVSGVTAADGLLAYYNVNGLLVPILNSMPGSDYMAFYSQQIGASYAGGFNPNWLGYDIDATYDITPNPAMLLTQNNGHLHWLHRGGERHRNFRERKAEIYFHEGGMIHE